MAAHTEDESAIRELVERWALAVRARDMPGILAHHSRDVVMFDLPPPLEARGIDAYRESWDVFFSWADDPVVFDFRRLDITAGRDVAFLTALMHCAGTEKSGERLPLEFRLTMGLRKIDGQWTIAHEHHSIPAP